MTVARSPAAIPATPLNVGVVSFVELPFAGVVSVIVGGVGSTVNVCGALKPVLFAASVCCACAVYVPAASAGEPSIVHEVPDLVATRVWTGAPDTVVPA